MHATILSCLALGELGFWHSSCSSMLSKIRSKELFEYADLGFYQLCSSLLCFTSPRAFNARVRTSIYIYIYIYI